jgi:hypothetical protein
MFESELVSGSNCVVAFVYSTGIHRYLAGNAMWLGWRCPNPLGLLQENAVRAFPQR